MKKLFTAIRQGKPDEVALILDKKPDLISCLAKAPPRKDDGQSPLMVAIKSDNLEVAHLLLDRGADVNFADAVNPYGSNFSAPIWYDAIGQCFMRARHTVGPGPERSKGYFLLLRRLLNMGMDPNRQTSYGLNAWRHTLDQYDQFAHDSFSDYYQETELEQNRRLREMLKAVLDGFYGLDSAKLTPYTVKYRGREHTYHPPSVEERRRCYETKWRELEPVLRAYYKKAR